MINTTNELALAKYMKNKGYGEIVDRFYTAVNEVKLALDQHPQAKQVLAGAKDTQDLIQRLKSVSPELESKYTKMMNTSTQMDYLYNKAKTEYKSEEDFANDFNRIEKEVEYEQKHGKEVRADRTPEAEEQINKARESYYDNPSRDTAKEYLDSVAGKPLNEYLKESSKRDADKRHERINNLREKHFQDVLEQERKKAQSAKLSEENTQHADNQLQDKRLVKQTSKPKNKHFNEFTQKIQDALEEEK